MYLSIMLISAFIFIASIILASFCNKIFPKADWLKPIHILLAGAFLAVYSVLLYVDCKPETHGLHTRWGLAFFHTAQVMLLGYDFGWLYNSIQLNAPYGIWMYFYLSILLCIAPGLTFWFLISFFERFTAYLKFYFHRIKNVFILSDISEESLALADSIRKKFPKALIVFSMENQSMDKLPQKQKNILKQIKAVCLNHKLSEIKLTLRSKRSIVQFFAINSDETSNLETALTLIENYSNRPNTELYVFSTSKEGECLLDSVRFNKMKVRRINTHRALAYSLIYQDETLLTKTATKQENETVISALIVGFGSYGEELTKAMLWCGQLPDYHLKINVIDTNPAAKERFRAQCPEIFELNHNTQFGEAIYHLNFFDGIDVDSYQFSETVSKLADTSVVYVALGNDELNIKTAIQLRILFERVGLYPVIRAVVYSDVKAKILKENRLVNYSGDCYDIEVIGTITDRYCYDTIIDRELEQLGLEAHLRWSNSPEEKEKAIIQFNEFEYFRNSSIATAIHEKYRAQHSLSDDISAVSEHMRWNAYMRIEGYIFSGSCDRTSRNNRAKMHHNLHRFGLLNTEDVEKDRRIVTKSESTL